MDNISVNRAEARPREIERFQKASEKYGYWNATPEENARVGISVPAFRFTPVVRRIKPTRSSGLGYNVRSLQRGPVAQLGARMNGIHEVTGSTPVWSTILSFPVSISRK
jgi:hypothetical protein